jgi:hypothetical protein
MKVKDLKLEVGKTMISKSRTAEKMALRACCALFFLISSLLLPISSFAQFLGYTSPQTVVATLATATSCTGTPQNFSTANAALNALGFRNIGQNQHTATLVMSGSTTNASIVIQALDSAGNATVISPIGQAGSALGSGIYATVSGTGSSVNVNIIVACASGGTFSLTYSGTSSSPPVVSGTQFLTLIDQQIFTGVNGASTENGTVFPTPFGNSSGYLRFNYASSPVAGSTMTVLCLTTTSSTTTLNQFAFPIANATGIQLFKVPPATCPQVQVLYTSGGAAGLITDEYIFDSPGAAVNTTLGTYTHVTTTTATAAKATLGTLVSITVNTPAAGTISIFDLPTASCTGTPATNTVAVITATATAPLGTIPYNLALLSGICVKASVAMDFTVSTQ